MVIEKILKVNTTNPKVDELRARLAQVQQKQGGAPIPTPTAPTPQVPVAKPQDDIARLQQLSAEEQKRLAERQNPELRLKEERTSHLIMNQIKELITLNNEATKRIKDLENKNAALEKQLETFREKNEDLATKMSSIDSRLEKFMGLYELVTNQYNPFADAAEKAAAKATQPSWPTPQVQPKPTTPAAPVQVKVEDSLTRNEATVQIKKEDAEVAQHSFKRVEELLADLQKKDDQPQPTATPPALTGELHAFLSGFEERLKQQFDRTLQEKLHHGFSSLEQNLQAEIRDALKEEIEQLQKDDLEVQHSLVELQELLQASEAANRGPVEEQLSSLTSSISHFRDDVKAIPPNLYFRVADGSILKDLKDLRRSLGALSPDIFNRHVGGGRNDFAEWVEHALRMPQLAGLLRSATSARMMYDVVTAHDGQPN